MAAITDLNELLNLQTGGNNGNPENIFFMKAPKTSGVTVTSTVAGRAASLWRYDGMPSAGDIPTSGAIPDLTTQGAIPFTAPGGGRDKILIGAGACPSTLGVFLLYDRIFHIGGLSGTSTAAQTVQGSPASPALTRNTGGAGNIAFYEIYTVIGSTSRTLTMTYTNQAGTGSRTSTINIGGTGFREVTRMQRIPLEAGDSGIQSVQSVQLNVSTGTLGNFGITIAQPLAWIPVGAAGTMGWRDWTTGLPGMPTINPNACLSLLFIPNAAVTTLDLFGCLSTVEK
jgi:hypothetical protein